MKQAGSELCKALCPRVPWDCCSCHSNSVPVPSVWDDVLCYGMQWLIKIFAVPPWLLWAQPSRETGTLPSGRAPRQEVFRARGCLAMNWKKWVFLGCRVPSAAQRKGSSSQGSAQASSCGEQWCPSELLAQNPWKGGKPSRGVIMGPLRRSHPAHQRFGSQG